MAPVLRYATLLKQKWCRGGTGAWRSGVRHYPGLQGATAVRILASMRAIGLSFVLLLCVAVASTARADIYAYNSGLRGGLWSVEPNRLVSAAGSRLDRRAL